MNKTAIKNFAIWARRKLIADITYKAGLIGISEKGIAVALPQSKQDLQFFDIGMKNYAEVSGKEVSQRAALVSAIKCREKTSDYKTAFQSVIEEVAYTWFNRLIAVRFMEVNDYLPSRVRVLSSETPKKNEPDFVTTPFDTDLNFTPYERDRVMQLKDENKLDELFRMLFIKQCNKLHEILPKLFEKTDDYTELLLAISFTDKDDVVYHLVHDIAEEDFNVSKEGQVEIIGWMYQYYNTEPKDEVFALLKKNVKITKERIPAATQLFTPDWIVRYMVENSLGRLWMEGHPNDSPKAGWKYYLEEAQQEPDVQMQLEKIRAEYKTIKPEDIKLIDPCMGSGHILVYAFDVLMQIYISCGYTERDAAKAILENNLYGLDIDDRAYQLAYFAVMMKARQYSRRILGERIAPNLCSIQQSNDLNPDYLSLFGNLKGEAQRLLTVFTDAKEYGSILNVPFTAAELATLRNKLTEIENAYYDNLFDNARKAGLVTLFAPILKQAEIMQRQYDVVVTNPPYMGSSGMSGRLAQYVKDNYPDSKSDLFACFIEKGNQMVKRNGYNCMVTMQSWMFLSSFEKMRTKLIASKTITNLMHMENMVLGIAFGTAVSIFGNYHISGYKGTYNQIKLCDIDDEHPKSFPVEGNRFAQVSTDNFSKIPGSPVAYWVSEKFIRAFENSPKLRTIARARSGVKTGKNEIFVMSWWEVSRDRMKIDCIDYKDCILSGKKWFPYNKGGNARNWYGNRELIIDFEQGGLNILTYSKANNTSIDLNAKDVYFKQGVTWTALTSSKNTFRFSPTGSVFDSNKGPMVFSDDGILLEYLLAFFISPIAQYSVKILNPSLSLQNGDMDNLPILIDKDNKLTVSEYSKENISLSKSDWDSFETSWDFKRHPLLVGSGQWVVGSGTESNRSSLITNHYKAWERECNDRFTALRANEEELNRIFIDIYGLADELTPEVEDKDVTVRKADLGRDIRGLISYAVGCMFGRYSLDVEGLAYAGGEWDGGKYMTFLPDADNCIPITDEEYFKDDIVGRFVEFVRTVYGADTLEENLDFIAMALGNKGNTSREVIRNYFLNDFFKNHCQIYQKRPIYWLFDSGKQNGFKALVYMHRWNADTTGNVRVEYLHKMQRVYESEIARMQETMDNSRNARDVAAAAKRKEKLVKQLKETTDYDAKIAHLALSRIDIDLDDGVKVNYEKVQTGQDGKKIEILGRI